MTRSSWRTSARLHEQYADTVAVTTDTVIGRYGMKETGFADDSSDFVNEETRRCKLCNEIKPLSLFPKNKAIRAGQERIYYNRVCKACRALKRSERTMAVPGTRKHLRQELADAPLAAAIKVMQQNPDALATVIRYHRTEFERFYNELKDAAIAREEARQEKYKSRPQNFKEGNIAALKRK